MATAGMKVISRSWKLCKVLVTRRYLSSQARTPRLKSNVKFKEPFYNVSRIVGSKLTFPKSVLTGTTFGVCCYLLRNGVIFAFSENDGGDNDNSEYNIIFYLLNIFLYSDCQLEITYAAYWLLHQIVEFHDFVGQEFCFM